jgi:hypothetical protein
MTFAMAAGLALLFSIIGAAIAGFAGIVIFDVPASVAILFLFGVYASAAVLIPLSLVANLVCAAMSQRDWPLHAAAVGLALLTWCVVAALKSSEASHPIRTDLPFGPVIGTAAVGVIPVQWATFLWGQRRRRKQPPGQQPTSTVSAG